MKLVAAKVWYYNKNLDYISEIKFGYEAVAQITDQGMSLVFVVPTEHSELYEDLATMTSRRYYFPICYRNYKLIPEMEGYDFIPKNVFEAYECAWPSMKPR